MTRDNLIEMLATKKAVSQEEKDLMLSIWDAAYLAGHNEGFSKAGEITRKTNALLREAMA